MTDASPAGAELVAAIERLGNALRAAEVPEPYAIVLDDGEAARRFELALGLRGRRGEIVERPHRPPLFEIGRLRGVTILWGKEDEKPFAAYTEERLKQAERLATIVTAALPDLSGQLYVEAKAALADWRGNPTDKEKGS